MATKNLTDDATNFSMEENVPASAFQHFEGLLKTFTLPSYFVFPAKKNNFLVQKIASKKTDGINSQDKVKDEKCFVEHDRRKVSLINKHAR